MIRFGLCCIFIRENIKFRTLTATHLEKFSRREQLEKISEICRHNSQSLRDALATVKRLGIGAFRVSSPLLPLYTHPKAGYELSDLPDAELISANLAKAHTFRREHAIRLSFHPDQFVVLNSPKTAVVANSMTELEYQGMLAEAVGAEVINLHLGGIYGDKTPAAKRFQDNFQHLSERVKSRLSLENDDISYTPFDLAPIVRELQIPLVYDVHHHRCLPDGLSIAEATAISIDSWQALGREPYFHLSSPKNGWHSKNPKPHADYIDLADFPAEWRDLNCNITVDIEAKAKELAVSRLMGQI